MNIAVKPGSVVVGVDGQPHSDAAAAWAAGYARAHDAPLCLLYAAGDLGPAALPHRAESAQILHAASRPVMEQVRGLVGRFADGLDVTVSAPLRDPEDALIEASERAVMIAVGSRGRGKMAALTLGSVSLAVAARAHCPVTVVPRSAPHAGPSAPVVVGVDLRAWSRAALDVAFDLASISRRRLVVEYAWRDHDTILDVSTYRHRLDVTEENERLMSESVARYADSYPGVAVECQLLDGGPIACLVDRSVTAAHVVVGTRERRGVAAVLGSVSRGVLEQARCPVTVARPCRTDLDEPLVRANNRV